jgi:hypothetical protein
MLAAVVFVFFISLMPLRCVIIWQVFTPDYVIQVGLDVKQLKLA